MRIHFEGKSAGDPEVACGLSTSAHELALKNEYIYPFELSITHLSLSTLKGHSRDQYQRKGI